MMVPDCCSFSNFQVIISCNGVIIYYIRCVVSKKCIGYVFFMYLCANLLIRYHFKIIS